MASAQILTNGKALYAYNGTEWVPLNTTGNLVNSTRWQYTAVGSETSLSGNDDYGDPLIYTPGYEQVYLNGVLLARDVDYTATNGTTITGLTALTAGYIVEIIAYNNINVGNTYTQAQIDNKIANTFERWTKTVSASGTVISGLDDNAVTLDYTAGLEKVYINGILLAPEEYVATSGSAITLDEAVVIDDIIQIHTLKNFRVANHYTINQTDDQFLTKTSASSTYLSQSSASSTYQTRATNAMVLLNTTSFTTQSTVSINNVFSANYDNYKILIKAKGSGNADVRMLLRASGIDATSNYNRQLINVDNTSVGGSRINSQSNGFFVSYVNSTYISGADIILFNPFLSSDTFLNSQYVRTDGSPTWTANTGLHTTLASYDGFTISPASGTFTGSVSVYGINA